jgi:hypothetical protein
VTWDTTKDTTKKEKKNNCPQHPKPTICACKIGYNNVMVAYNYTIPWWQSIHPAKRGEQSAATAAKHLPMKKTPTMAKHP